MGGFRWVWWWDPGWWWSLTPAVGGAVLEWCWGSWLLPGLLSPPTGPAPCVMDRTLLAYPLTPPHLPPPPPSPCSHSIMDRALMHCDCVYRLPAVRAQGHICSTNHPSHTAFRGFGGPQAS